MQSAVVRLLGCRLTKAKRAAWYRQAKETKRGGMNVWESEHLIKPAKLGNHPRDPVEGRGCRNMELREGKMAETSSSITILAKRPWIAQPAVVPAGGHELPCKPGSSNGLHDYPCVLSPSKVLPWFEPRPKLAKLAVPAVGSNARATLFFLHSAFFILHFGRLRRPGLFLAPCEVLCEIGEIGTAMDRRHPAGLAAPSFGSSWHRVGGLRP